MQVQPCIVAISVMDDDANSDVCYCMDVITHLVL